MTTLNLMDHSHLLPYQELLARAYTQAVFWYETGRTPHHRDLFSVYPDGEVAERCVGEALDAQASLLPDEIRDEADDVLIEQLLEEYGAAYSEHDVGPILDLVVELAQALLACTRRESADLPSTLTHLEDLTTLSSVRQLVAWASSPEAMEDDDA